MTNDYGRSLLPLMRETVKRLLKGKLRLLVMCYLLFVNRIIGK